VQKKLRALLHEKKVLSATPRYSAHSEIQAKTFLVDTARHDTYHGIDSTLCNIAQRRLYLHISLRIRNHMQKLFNPLTSDPSGID
jgi:hypothetical protein